MEIVSNEELVVEINKFNNELLNIRNKSKLNLFLKSPHRVLLLKDEEGNTILNTLTEIDYKNILVLLGNPLCKETLKEKNKNEEFFLSCDNNLTEIIEGGEKEEKKQFYKIFFKQLSQLEEEQKKEYLELFYVNHLNKINKEIIEEMEKNKLLNIKLDWDLISRENYYQHGSFLKSQTKLNLFLSFYPEDIKLKESLLLYGNKSIQNKVIKSLTNYPLKDLDLLIKEIKEKYELGFFTEEELEEKNKFLLSLRIKLEKQELKTIFLDEKELVNKKRL